MIINDSLLQQRIGENRPILVGMIGAGFMARGIALQLIKYTPGIRLAAICNTHLDKARTAYEQAGATGPVTVDSVGTLDEAIASGQPTILDNPEVLCRSTQIEVVLEVTGTIEFAARAVVTAMEHGKHVILMNSELDATLGPILKVRADRAGVIYSNCDGDQPGVIINLYRFAKGMGFRPVLLGNIKGLHDPYRTPETQKGYAEKYRQKPKMVTSFADGTKISMEMAAVGNATGFGVGQRGMYGPSVPAGTSIKQAASWYPESALATGSAGMVDYVVGAEPAGGVFVIGRNEDPIQREYLNYYKMGDGPLYVFSAPCHLCHFEVPFSIVRVVLLRDAVLAPAGAPVVDVVTVAKRDLQAGELLDGMGGFTAYGVAENAATCHSQRLLPMGLSEGCRVKRALPRDSVIKYSDVELPPDRFCDQLRNEQNRFFTQSLSPAKSW